jgi:hypothetical protein
VVSKDPQMSKCATAGKRKHLTLRRLENGESWCVVMASNNTGLYLWFRETERPIMTVYSIKWKCEGPFKVTDVATASISTIRQVGV